MSCQSSSAPAPVLVQSSSNILTRYTMPIDKSTGNYWSSVVDFFGWQQQRCSYFSHHNLSSIILTPIMFLSSVHIERHFALLLSTKHIFMFNMVHPFKARFVHCRSISFPKYLETNLWWRGHGWLLWWPLYRICILLHCVDCLQSNLFHLGFILIGLKSNFEQREIEMRTCICSAKGQFVSKGLTLLAEFIRDNPSYSAVLFCNSWRQSQHFWDHLKRKLNEVKLNVDVIHINGSLHKTDKFWRICPSATRVTLAMLIIVC